jgi:hypothetical protein
MMSISSRSDLGQLRPVAGLVGLGRIAPLLDHLGEDLEHFGVRRLIALAGAAVLDDAVLDGRLDQPQGRHPAPLLAADRLLELVIDSLAQTGCHSTRPRLLRLKRSR